MKMKKQKLTPEQYRNANKVLMLVLSVVAVIFVLVEFYSGNKGNMGLANYVRIAIYLLSVVAINVFVRINIEKKSAMVFMAANILITYSLLVFGNGPGAMVMVFPIVAVFMVYLNARLVFFGFVGSFIVCVIRSAIMKNSGAVSLGLREISPIR